MKRAFTIGMATLGATLLLSACGPKIEIRPAQFAVTGERQAVLAFAADQIAAGSTNISISPGETRDTARATFHSARSQEIVRLAQKASEARLGWSYGGKSTRISVKL